MKFPDKVIGCIADLIDHLCVDRPASQPVWYRGHAVSDWRLTCLLHRHGGNERTLIKRFKQNALPYVLQRPQSEWEWLFVMQHHSLPTRLLDWTESPLVGLYFAVAGVEHSALDGALWCLTPLELNLANKFKAEHAGDIPGMGDDDHLENYLPSKLPMQPEPLPTLAALAQRNNPRMQVQHGVFTISHLEETPLETGEPNYLWKYVIPRDKKTRIREELSLLYMNKLSLFPELDNVADHARESGNA